MRVAGFILGGVILAAGAILIYNAVKKKTGSTKYKVGDILYNPPDTADVFTIVSIQSINNQPYYNFFSNRGAGFSEPASLVDNDPAHWIKV